MIQLKKQSWRECMKKIVVRIIFALLIFSVVTALAILLQQSIIYLLYSTILALFATEIKTFFQRIPTYKNVRLSYSYVFKIEFSGQYLLVKDEQGRNNFHPVGGVYKFNPDNIEDFEVEYDRVFDVTPDTKDDLRIIIKHNDLKKFETWFQKNEDREIMENLSREFKEELIDRGILPKEVFSSVKYKYNGSHTQKSYNNALRMKQIRHFDIVTIKLTNAQKEYLNSLLTQVSDQYVFATKDDICTGQKEANGKHYAIAEYTDLIVTGTNKKLVKEQHNPTDQIKCIITS